MGKKKSSKKRKVKEAKCRVCGKGAGEVKFYGSCKSRCATCENKQRYAERKKNWTDEEKRAQYERIYKWSRENKEKIAARKAVLYAVKVGKLRKPSKCSKCGKVANLDGHHPDYSKKLEVIWLCRECHQKLHRNY